MFKNWKTTITGALMLAGMGLQIAKGAQKTDPMTAMMEAFTDPTKISIIAGGAGLILAKDSGKAESEVPPATK